MNSLREMAKTLATKTILFLRGCRNLARVKSDTPLAFESTVYGRQLTQILLVSPAHLVKKTKDKEKRLMES